jgi:phage gp36-like protein
MYATRDDIAALYSESFVADLLPAEVEDADAAADTALASASAEIDSYVGVRYTLPLAGRPAMLVRPAIDIAAYILANRHSVLTDTIEKRYDQAVELLTKISTGKAGLGADEPAVDTGGDGNPSSGADFAARPRRFSRETL